MELCTGGSLFNLLDDPENSYGLDEVTKLCTNSKNTCQQVKFSSMIALFPSMVIQRPFWGKFASCMWWTFDSKNKFISTKSISSKMSCHNLFSGWVSPCPFPSLCRDEPSQVKELSKRTLWKCSCSQGQQPGPPGSEAGQHHEVYQGRRDDCVQADRFRGS